MLLIANVKTIIYTAWKAAVFNSCFKKKKKKYRIHQHGSFLRLRNFMILKVIKAMYL